MGNSESDLIWMGSLWRQILSYYNLGKTSLLLDIFIKGHLKSKVKQNVKLVFSMGPRKGPKKGVIVKVEIEYNRPFLSLVYKISVANFGLFCGQIKQLWYLVCLYVLLKKFLKLEVVTSGYIYPKIEDIFSFCSAFSESWQHCLKSNCSPPSKEICSFLL